MKRIVPLTSVCALALAGSYFLPAAAAWPAAGGVLLLYLVLCGWGTVSLRSGIFTRALTRAPEAASRACLTYDDGPDPAATPRLLDLLRERGVRATFFLVGSRVRAHPAIARRCREEGHLLANHSDRHSWLTNFYFTSRMRRELAACQSAIAAAAGVTPEYYRPPFGLANHAVDGAARALGLKVVGWQVRSLDSAWLTVEQVVRRTLRKVRPGGIILLHDGRRDPERVAAITAGILDGLRERGLSAVRLDELFEESAS